ncbi:hypothetical protein HNR12_000739 [Streptomonospora nanhaiensis]|uniref:Uncharacterized protein n=1 Tax=Streptomonospora nanhaiensis TaxID=1323731 RepID=A0A853BIQ0_9ACTN|nr:hypothetical protein [Streptomonospora nanhaiensis]NYI94462.1 hypothetical protein [Streptomonospora nanhaiensis]
MSAALHFTVYGDEGTARKGARQAFTSGLDTLALVGAAVLVVAAAAAFAALRGVTPATDPDGPR